MHVCTGKPYIVACTMEGNLAQKPQQSDFTSDHGRNKIQHVCRKHAMKDKQNKKLATRMSTVEELDKPHNRVCGLLTIWARD